MVTANSKSIKEDEPVEIKFKAEGVYNVRDETPILMFEDCTCQVVVGLKEKCCILTTIKTGDHQENLTICTESKSEEHCQMQSIVLAKKLAVDCSRFKDKNNDITSLNNTNNELVSELMSKRLNIEELDGNRYEAFSKIPTDSRLPIQLVSRENVDIPAESDDDVEEEEVEKIDLSKGIFIAKGYAAELGVDGSRDKVDITMDPKMINIGDDVQEKFENMVWPCKNQRDICSPQDFFETKGFEKDKLSAWKRQ